MFTRSWADSALNDLANIYVTLAGPDQERVAAGVETLNVQLSLDPFEVGESREGGRRIAFIPLLQVLFDVDKAARRARVAAVARFGR